MDSENKSSAGFQVREKVVVNGEGTITELVMGQTNSNVPYINLVVESKGKYVETIPCVLYGVLAETNDGKLKVGDKVSYVGRLRSKTKETHISLQLVVEKINVIK